MKTPLRRNFDEHLLQIFFFMVLQTKSQQCEAVGDTLLVCQCAGKNFQCIEQEHEEGVLYRYVVRHHTTVERWSRPTPTYYCNRSSQREVAVITSIPSMSNIFNISRFDSRDNLCYR